MSFRVVSLVGAWLCAPISAQVTQRVSVSSQGVEGNGSSYGGSISADGRYVAFGSSATDLVPGDTNSLGDVFVRDRQSGMTVRVSIDSAGVQSSGQSFSPSMSADGRYVAFGSDAHDLVAGDSNGTIDVFVHDLQTGATERASVDSGGVQGNGNSTDPVISSDGRFVAFISAATNLVPGDTNGFLDIFVRDRLSGTTEQVSVGPSGSQGNGDSGILPGFPNSLSISNDGRYVAFSTYATNLVQGGTMGAGHIVLRDRQIGTSELISVGIPGELRQMA